MGHFFYFARCNDNSLYAGYTTNIEKREKAHNDGKGGAYTSSHRPIRIVYFEEFEAKSEALKRECEVKKWSKSQKETFLRSKVS